MTALPLIRCEKLDKWYSGVHALHGIDLDIHAGEIIGLVGDNGAGKSTLIKLLAGLYQPVEGLIEIDGEPAAALAAGAWYEQLSACFQDFSRLQFTLGRAVGLGRLAQLDEEPAVRRALAAGAAQDIVAQLPAGLATNLGASFDDGIDLSGGQWQRLALARARMRPAPCLLVLDEPTSAIDPIAEDALLSKYIEAARRATDEVGGITLFASHRMSMARTADVIVVIDEGRIAELGSHEELMSRPDGIYHGLYERQIRAYA